MRPHIVASALTLLLIAFSLPIAFLMAASGFVHPAIVGGAVVEPLSPRMVYASRSGAVADANLETGAVVTDSSAALNAILAQASATNPVTLVLDGAYAASLDVAKGYCTIQGSGRGSGLVNPSPASKEIIYNSNAQRYSQTGSTSVLARRVILRDFRVNGGRTTAGGMVNAQSNVHLENIDDVEISGVRMEQPDAWNLALVACNRVAVTRCQFLGTQSPNPIGTGSNQDGIHLCAATSNVTISDCYFATNDDAIALNWNEGYFNAPVGGGSSGGTVTISNCVFDNCLCAVRDLAGGVYSDRIVMTNCTGTVQMCVWKAGVEGGEANGGIQRNFSISNCAFAVTGPSPYCYFNFCGYAANLQVSNFTMIAPTQGIPLLGTSGGDHQHNGAGSVSIDGLTIHYDANGSAADYIWDGSFPIAELSISGFRQACDPGVSVTNPSALISLTGAYGANRLRLRDWSVRYANDIVKIQNSSSAGVANSILITGLDASGLTNRAVNLISGLIPTTVVIEGVWASASQAPLGIVGGQTLANLGTVGLYSTYSTPYSGGGSVTNSITNSGGSYTGP